MKKKCFCLLLLFSTLLLFCFSVGEANVDMTNFHEDSKPYNDYDLFNQLILQTFNQDYEELNVNFNNTTQYENSFNYFLDTDYIACYLENTTTQVVCNLAYNDTFQSTKIASIGVTKYGNGTFRILASITNNTSSNLNGNTVTNGLNKFLRKNSQWYNTTWNTLDYSPITFNFNYFTNYRVTFDSENCLAYVLPYSSYTWLLGQASGFNDVDEVIFYLRDKNNIVVAQFTYSAQGTFDMPMYMSDIGNLWIQSRIVEYRKLYKLEYEVWVNGSIIDNFYRYVVFLPTNSVVNSSGDVTTIGSGDFNSQDATNNIINTINGLTSSGDIFAIVSGELFSGDSGDILARFGYENYENPYTDFIERCFYGIMTAMTSEGNVTLIWPVRDKQIVLNSNDFTINSITFKILLSGILVFFIIYKLYAKFKYLIDELQEGNINYTLEFKDSKFSEYWFF